MKNYFIEDAQSVRTTKFYYSSLPQLNIAPGTIYAIVSLSLLHAQA